MRIEDLNALSAEDAFAELRRCCGSRRWARLMAERRPFASPARLAETADQIWWSLSRADWLQAFAAHPRIGTPTAMPGGQWAAGEQSRMNAATEGVRERIVQANRDYEARFGYIFIVCATGKSGPEMLAILESRLLNTPEDELKIAAAEQATITRLRLTKLLS